MTWTIPRPGYVSAKAVQYRRNRLREKAAKFPTCGCCGCDLIWSDLNNIPGPMAPNEGTIVDGGGEAHCQPCRWQRVLNVAPLKPAPLTAAGKSLLEIMQERRRQKATV